MQTTPPECCGSRGRSSLRRESPRRGLPEKGHDRGALRLRRRSPAVESDNHLERDGGSDVGRGHAEVYGERRIPRADCWIRCLFRHARVAVLALLCVAATAKADDSRLIIQVQDGVVRSLAGEVLEVQGGAYLPSESLMSLASELAALRAENEVLKSATVKDALIVAAVLLGVVAGAGSVLLLRAR